MPPLLLALPDAPVFELPAAAPLPDAPGTETLVDPALNEPLPPLVIPAPDPSGASSTAPLLQEAKIKAVSTALEKRTPQRSKRG
jgi:hypothetical protein